MKGIIVDYFVEKGFGFIKDENEEKRFFHISNIKEKSRFLNNIEDYLYTEWVERICYVVDFLPGENSKGLNAINIDLTNQIFNDKSVKTIFEANVVDVKYTTHSLTRIVSGFKKGMGAPFDATAGGNGTYRVGYPEVLREHNIYFRRTDKIGWGSFDVRDQVLKINNRSKITDRFVESLKNHLIGKKVSIAPNHRGWIFLDEEILKL